MLGGAVDQHQEQTASLRLAEPVAALSLATDLGMGQPMDSVLLSAVLGVRLVVVASANGRELQITRVMMPLIALAVPPMRGLVENLYIFHEPYIVDHSAYASAFGDDATPLREAIRQTVAWARRNPERKPVPSPQPAMRSETRESTSP